MFNASWVLFSAYQEEEVDLLGGNSSDSENGGTHKYKAYRFSGKNHSFDSKVDRPIVKLLRKFSNDYLSVNSIVHKTNITLLADAYKEQERAEIDLLVKIMKFYERDEQSWELLIKDLSQDAWYMTVNKLTCAAQFREGEVYRIRGVNVDRTTDRKVITTKKSTNFLKFNKSSLVFRELHMGVRDEIEADDGDEFLLNPKHVTKVTTEPDDINLSDSKNLKLFRLQDLFTDYDSLSEEQK